MKEEVQKLYNDCLDRIEQLESNKKEYMDNSQLAEAQNCEIRMGVLAIVANRVKSILDNQGLFINHL